MGSKKKMKFATTFIAAATASGMGSANDASALNCGSDAQIASCWEAYATFIPAANQTAGGDITGPYGTEWDLQTSSGACGITIAEATSVVNQTCEVSWTAVASPTLVAPLSPLVKTPRVSTWLPVLTSPELSLVPSPGMSRSQTSPPGPQPRMPTSPTPQLM